MTAASVGCYLCEFLCHKFIQVWIFLATGKLNFRGLVDGNAPWPFFRHPFIQGPCCRWENMHYWVPTIGGWGFHVQIMGLPSRKIRELGARHPFMQTFTGGWLFVHGSFQFRNEQALIFGPAFQSPGPLSGSSHTWSWKSQKNMSLMTHYCKSIKSFSLINILASCVICHALNLNHHNHHAEAAQEVWNLKLETRGEDDLRSCESTFAIHWSPISKYRKALITMLESQFVCINNVSFRILV